jgi:Mg-chelatase subunit ChlD/flagellar basal body-associated protein FliL
MYCKYCGKEIQANSKFCPFCGGRMENEVNKVQKPSPVPEELKQPEGNQPEGNKPEIHQQENIGQSIQPNGSKPEYDQQMDIKPENIQPQEFNPENIQPQNDRPEVFQPEKGRSKEEMLPVQADYYEEIIPVLDGSVNNSNNLEQVMEEQLSTKKKKHRFFIPLAIAIFILFSAICATVYVTGSEGFKLKRQLSLGEKYLSEMEYEKAVAAFTKAIEIEPKCMEAYLGLADAYLGLGDDDNAIEALLKGITVVEQHFKDNKELIPRWSELYIKLANIYINADRYKDARDILQRGIKLGDSSDIQKKLQEVDNYIAELLDKYKQSYDAFLVHFPEYIMTEEETAQYNTGIEKLTTGMDNIDVDECEDTVEDLEALEEKLIDSNLQLVTESKDNLQQQDTSSAFDAEKDMIESYSVQVEDMINKQLFVSAKKILDEWEALLATISKAGEYSMEVTQVDVSEYPIVKLYIRVSDVDTGETLDTLEYQYFSLKEKNAKTSEYTDIAIEKAVQLDEQENTNISLVADVSSSMEGDAIARARSIIDKFLGTIQFDIGDQAELITFASDVYTDVAFTTDKKTLRQAAKNMVTRDMTALYDALYNALISTAQQSGAKCIIAFTDGMDNESSTSYESVVDLAQQYRIPIFIIGVGSSIDESTITYVAEASGGFYRNVNDISSMEDIYNNIYRQQKMLYLIQYKTETPIEEVASQDVYINYNGNDITSRSEYEYTPSELMEAVTSNAQLFYKDFIIYDSDSRYLTTADLDQLSEEELKWARNEIYARRGRKFKDPDLKAYFESKSWYSGTVEPEDFTEAVLNEYERANAYFIKQYENDKGYNTEG